MSEPAAAVEHKERKLAPPRRTALFKANVDRVFADLERHEVTRDRLRASLKGTLFLADVRKGLRVDAKSPPKFGKPVARIEAGQSVVDCCELALADSKLAAGGVVAWNAVRYSKVPGLAGEKGALCAEGDLLRRTALFASLDTVRDRYPLLAFQAVWSPSVLVFRSEDGHLLDWSECRAVSVLTMSVDLRNVGVASWAPSKEAERDRKSTVPTVSRDQRLMESMYVSAVRTKNKTLVVPVETSMLWRASPNDSLTATQLQAMGRLHRLCVNKYGGHFASILFAVEAACEADFRLGFSA